jgi:hypothetical protein
MDATNKVFGLPELLEMILLSLQPQDLLRIQRISRTFYSTIKQSTQLQRKLFYQQDPTPYPDPFDLPRINPFIRKAVQRFAKVSIETFEYDFCEFQNCRPPIAHITQFCVSIKVKEYSGEILDRLEAEFGLWRPPWQGMYLTARPCDVAIETNLWACNDAHLPPGAKMSDLVQLMRELYKEGLIG